MEEKKDTVKPVVKRAIRKAPVKKTDDQLVKEELLKKITELEAQLKEKEENKVDFNVYDSITPDIKEANKEKIEKMRLKDRELVVGTFKFHDVKGGHIKFDFNKYADDPIEKFMLVDGHRYALPLGVAKHLRDSGKYITYPGTTDIYSNSVRPMVVHDRYSFDRDDFDESEDISKIDRGYAPKNAR